jgi:ATP phosphoribosyltransferase-like protein
MPRPTSSRRSSHSFPACGEATVSPLYGDAGFAVKAAVPRDQLARVIPAVKAAGGSDLVVTALNQIVP